MENLSRKINELILGSNEYKEAKKAEEKMLSDPTTFSLLIEYQNKQKEYNDAIRFENYGSDVDKVKKELADIKYKVDTNPLVIEYNNCYKKINEVLTGVKKIILDGIGD